MQPRPRQDVLPGFRVAILRLVHVHKTTKFTRFIGGAFPWRFAARVTLSVLDMRILDRYIVREVFRHAFLGLVVFTFVFFVPQLFA